MSRYFSILFSPVDRWNLGVVFVVIDVIVVVATVVVVVVDVIIVVAAVVAAYSRSQAPRNLHSKWFTAGFAVFISLPTPIHYFHSFPACFLNPRLVFSEKTYQVKTTTGDR